MSRQVRVVVSISVTGLLVALLVGVALAGSPEYMPHLGFVGFNTLGEPSNGVNSEIVIDVTTKFAYVGAINFDPSEDDLWVKAVDVSDPANPVVTDEQATLDGFDTSQGNFGVFDVKIAGNVLAASTQGFPSSNPGITLMDITNPSDPHPVSHLAGTDILSPSGSHNSFLWQDPLTNSVWLFACGLDLTSMMLFDVTDPLTPVFRAGYNNGSSVYVHDCFTQEVGERVFNFQAGAIGVEILDVTSVVRGGQPGPLTAANVVGFNHYTSDGTDAAKVTRPGFAHYIEPTASGNVLWVGDEAGCGEPAIIRSLDSSNLPAIGAGSKFLAEMGTIIAQPDADMCQGLLNGNPNNLSQLQEYRWTGHNFDVWSDGLLIRGDYGRGVSVFDISDPDMPFKVANSRGLNLGTGEENKADPGREKFLENPTFIWAAVYDGDLIYASDINQGIYILDLVGD